MWVALNPWKAAHNTLLNFLYPCKDFYFCSIILTWRRREKVPDEVTPRHITAQHCWYYFPSHCFNILIQLAFLNIALHWGSYSLQCLQLETTFRSLMKRLEKSPSRLLHLLHPREAIKVGLANISTSPELPPWLHTASIYKILDWRAEHLPLSCQHPISIQVKQCQLLTAVVPNLFILQTSKLFKLHI